MLEKEELLQIVGGINITGTLINALYKGINTIMDIGRSLGSAIRRYWRNDVSTLIRKNYKIIIIGGLVLLLLPLLPICIDIIFKSGNIIGSTIRCLSSCSL